MVVLGAAALLAYHNSFSGVFLLDDASSIAENGSIRQLWPVHGALWAPREAGVAGRPLANLSFALNYALSGLDVWSYHALALVLHGLTALALFGVVHRTLMQPTLRPLFGTRAVALALLIAALWTVHPLGSAVVDYISQRTEGLMALCYLTTLYCFIRTTESGSRRWQVASILACAFGMASKEVTVTAPLMVLLYDRTFVSGTFQHALQRNRFYYLGLASTWLLLAALMIGSRVAERGIGVGMGITPLDYAITACGALVTYLQLACWPSPLVFDYGWAYAREPVAVTVNVFLCAAFVGATLHGLWRRSLLGFAGAWVLLILAPTSSVVPVVHQPIAESRMYLPLAAIIAAAVLVAYRTLRDRAWIGGGVAALALTGVTVPRNELYHDALALWSDTLTKRPTNARAMAERGSALVTLGRVEEGIAGLADALRLAPGYPEAHINLGLALAGQRRTAEALEHHHAALRSWPHHPEIHCNIGNALVAAGRPAEALPHFETALRYRPDHVRALNNFGVALIHLGHPGEALRYLESALRHDPRFVDAHYNLASAWIGIGNENKAIELFKIALRLKPDLAKAHNNLGVLHLRAGRRAEALEHFQSALRAEPDYADARRNLELFEKDPAAPAR